MNKIERLIERLCPSGVEWKTLGEVATIERGVRVVRKQLNEESGYPVYQNSLKSMGFYCESNRRANLTFVICAGAAGEIGFSDVDFWSADDCYTVDGNGLLLDRYIYHFLLMSVSYLKSQVRKASIPRLSRKVIDSLSIPVPPPEIQSEIVQVLDNFAKLTAELTAELAKRKKQYEHYRDTMLTMKSGTPYFTLSEVCDYVDYRGKTPKKTEKGVFLVTAKNIKKGYIDYESSREYISDADYEEVMHRGKPQLDDVLITTEAPCGNVALVDRTDIALAQRVIKYRPKDKRLNSKFLKFYLLGREFQDELNRQATGGTVKGIKGSKLHQMSIPLPPLAEQERIVAILDKFDKLVNSLTEGLPAEIAGREKQYAYYRDKLLSFGKGNDGRLDAETAEWYNYAVVE